MACLAKNIVEYPEFKQLVKESGFTEETVFGLMSSWLNQDPSGRDGKFPSSYKELTAMADKEFYTENEDIVEAYKQPFTADRSFESWDDPKTIGEHIKRMVTIFGNDNVFVVKYQSGETDVLVAKPVLLKSQQTLDIWAGQNPTNADLSNFAYRPFTIPMGFQLPNGTFVSIPWQARSVEAAFQALKLNYTNKGTLEEEAENNEIQKAILSGRWQSEREDGAAVKRLGNKIKNLNQPAWNRDRQAIMKELIKMSFQQNPQALQRLLATGDAVLTHNRESSESIWRTEFPRILMEVREELKRAHGTTLGQRVATQGTTQQYGVVIDSKLKSNYAQWQ